jgi:hypothetical protein
MKPWTPLIRTGGNFGVTFFSTLTTFNFISDLPITSLVVGALLTAGVTTGLAISYEAKKFTTSRK